MNSKLIADAGSTNIEWTLIGAGGDVIQSLVTEGVNALLSSKEDIERVFKKARGMLLSDFIVEEIHYYGAGCATHCICDKVMSSLLSVWKDASCVIKSDLLAAARSLLFDKKGIVCILGTGSNSCLYDGKDIVSQIPSLGYVLGDEGSGAALGKRLIGDIYKKQLPDHICQKFMDEYKLTLADLLDKIYREQFPNRFMASFVPFIYKNISDISIHAIVLSEFTSFLKRNVAMYVDARSLEICFTGSVAFYFENILREASSHFGYNVTDVTQNPMEGLIRYHTL